jgi:hypothetical protein
MAILTREAILAAQDISRELVEVPEWGGEVLVRGLTGQERDKFEASTIQQRGNNQSINLQNLRAKLCSLAVCDENGKRVFTDMDVAALGQKSASALDRVYEVAKRLAGLGEVDVEELTKGLEESPFEGSPSD